MWTRNEKRENEGQQLNTGQQEENLEAGQRRDGGIEYGEIYRVSGSNGLEGNNNNNNTGPCLLEIGNSGRHSICFFLPNSDRRVSSKTQNYRLVYGVSV